VIPGDKAIHLRLHLIVCASQSPTCAGAALKATSGAVALRGAMALTLRSIASPEQELNLCSLWLNHDYRFSPFPLTSYQTWQNSLLEKTSIGLSILCFIAFTKITDACAAALPMPTLPCGILPHTTDPSSDEHRSKDIQFLINREASPV